MKTIELNCGGTKAQFTTKSVTFNGMEFFYSNMSGVSHNAEECTYTFTYNNETVVLPYESKDARILSAIFMQVQMLESKKAAAQAAHTAPPEQKPEPDHKPEHESAETPISSQQDDSDILPKSGGLFLTPEQKADDKDSAAEEPPADVQDMNPEELPTDVQDAHTEDQQPADAGQNSDLPEAEEPKTQSEEKSEEPKKKLSFFPGRKKESAEKKTAETEPAEKEPADPEKSAKIKKAFIIFGVIILVFAAASVLTYFIFGTADDPSQIAPNAVESQQYDDIDDIINDLQ